MAAPFPDLGGYAAPLRIGADARALPGTFGPGSLDLRAGAELPAGWRPDSTAQRAQNALSRSVDTVGGMLGRLLGATGDAAGQGAGRFVSGLAAPLSLPLVIGAALAAVLLLRK